MLTSQTSNNDHVLRNNDIFTRDNDLQVQHSVGHSQQLVQPSNQQASQDSHRLGQPSEPHKHPSQSPYQSNLSTSSSIASPISNHTQLCHPQVTLQSPTQLTGSHRRRLTSDETEYLLRQYHFNEKPSTKDRSVFAAHLNLHPRTIQVWFQNRRAKLRRENSLMGRLSNSQGAVRSNGDNDIQDCSRIRDTLNNDNRVQSNLGYDVQVMVTGEVDEARQNQWKGKENNVILSTEFIPTALYNQGEMEAKPVAPHLHQWRCEARCDHGHRFRSWFPYDPTMSDTASDIGQQNPLMLHEIDQVLHAESPSRFVPPLGHPSNDTFNLVPTAAAEPATHDPYSTWQHRQQRLRRQPQQQRYPMKRIQERPMVHAKGAQVGVPSHQKALTLVASYPFIRIGSEGRGTKT
jgi:hypothetical protein